ncbi:MAG: peptide ABC transporter substrate-binding protein [Fusobacteriaceae bacterium]
MKRKFSFLMFLSLILAFFTGCGSENSKNEVVSQNKILYSMDKEPETLDPSLNIYARSSKVLQNLFRGLYRLDENDRLTPALAESHEVDSSGTVYTIKLKSNLKWSDGTPLNANDFYYSWTRVLNPETASRAAFDLYPIKNAESYNTGLVAKEEVGIKVLDDNTLQVTLENPTSYFPDLLATTTYFPVKQELVEGKEPWTKSVATYASSGPFMLTEIKPKEKYTLTKNPHYVGADHVKLDTLEIVFLESPETELGAYLNGEIDVAENLSSEAKSRFKDTKDLNTSGRIGYTYYDFNTTRAPFDDARVRKAFAISINREILIKNIIQSTNKPMFSFVPDGIPHGVQKDKNYREVMGDLFKEDVVEAQKLLAEAGYPNGENFPKVSFNTSATQTNRDVAQALQNMWKTNLNVDVEIVTYESKVYWSEVHNGNFFIANDGWAGDYPDPMTNLNIFQSPQNVKNNRWLNENYDALIKENKTIVDQAKRMENFKKAEEILAQDMPIMPIFQYQSEFLVNPRVKGVRKNYIGHTIFEFAEIVK